MAIDQEIELLTVLIEKYDAERNPMFQMNPSALLRSFLAERNALSQKELAKKLAVSEGYVSDLVNGKKNISKQMALKLSALFMVRPEAFYTPFQGLGSRLPIPKKELAV
jgi:HTH-type transcriptional regulator/antitoxin HigA